MTFGFGFPPGFSIRISSVAVAALFSTTVISPPASAASSLPEPIPGWQMELVAEAPKITHPTVVACAPDGRIFVAEDPMDISLPKADAAAGRIVCLFPDGRVTVFADKLYAVFGMQYLEGKLYVLHNPKFSVFEDDNGVGRNRRDLIKQTLPEPSALNWNDHVPANFRLGMDGFFYFASGDKGLHGAKGTDGSEAELFTGGIFRLRPDGTQLGVVSDGVRNILDVALNAEDEMFTYDNTDEHDWMGRFTHMVDGGFYGYPHDFIPQQPYTLWMMDDFGAGAACGVFANTEDALPPEFQDNVFLSDFGKRQIMRVRIERAGGTYRVVSKQDLFPNPPGDFRPVGITPGPDGKSIYVCDWQHLDDKEEVSVGRLFKLTWTGQDLSAPKPAWYVPAASGQPFAATTSELVSGLSHPSRNVRLTAQRRLADRGATQELLALLRDTSAPALARAHALWALDAIDGGRIARPDIIAVSRDSDPVVRRQAIRQLGARQTKVAVPGLREALRDLDASVRFQAATALGRIGDAEAIPDLLSGLEQDDLFARYAVFTALHRIGVGEPSAWPAIVQGLADERGRVREGTAYALRETYDEQLLAALVALFKDNTQPSAVRRQALDLMASLHHRVPAWKGQWWAYHPALEPPPPKTETWPGTDTVLATLRDGLRESDPDLRRACIEGLAVAHDTVSVSALREIYPREKDPVSRATILRTLGAMKDAGAVALITSELQQPSHSETTAAAIGAAREIGGDQAIQALIVLLSSPNADAKSLAPAVAALGGLRAQSATAAIEPLTAHPAAAVRAASYRALSRLRGEAAVRPLEDGLTDPSPDVRHAVVQALGDLKSNLAVPALLQAYADETLRADAFTELTRTPDARAIDALLDGLSSRNPTDRNAAHLAIRSIKDKVLEAVNEKAGLLSSQALTELRHIYAGNKQAEAGPIFAKQIKHFALEEYLEAAVKLSGDPERGRKLFAEPGGVNCTVCHRVAGQGNVIGPDLSSAGAQFDRRTLAEAILYPSKAVREGYQQVIIEMDDDQVISGVVKGETADTLTLRDNSGVEHKVPRASIKSRHNSALSLMPDGLQAALSLEEFADLVAYLASLKGEPQPAGIK